MLAWASCVPLTPPAQPGARALLESQARRYVAPTPAAPAQTPAPAAEAQTPANVPATDQVTRPISEPYTGKLDIFEGKDRERRLQIDRVMQIIGVREGASVADIGAGSGWFTTRAARKVGSTGQVFAVEINQEYLDYIRARAERESLANIRPVLGGADDPRLAPGSVDAVLMLKTYHEVQQPLSLLRNVRAALKPGGRLGIIDRNPTPDNDHGASRDDVVREAERSGLRLVEEHDFVKPEGEDYLLVFTPAG